MKILIIDDSLFFRKILKDTLELLDPSFDISTAVSGKLALVKLPSINPDIIFLDQCMPDMNGIETLQHIKKDFPNITVIMISGVDHKVAEVTFKALSLGALDFIPKPHAQSQAENKKKLTEQISKVLTAHRQKTTTNDYKPARSTSRISTSRPATVIDKSFSLVVIGVSTGGPKALEKVIPSLSANLGCPVLIVQHMPAKFTASLAKHLDAKSALQVVEASDQQSLEDNTVYIAPGDFHMRLRKNSAQNYCLVLDQSEPVNACRPSVDILFESVALTMDKPVISCILTGMGKDGYNGVRALKKRNTFSIAQSKETCVVYGMPKIIIESQLTDEVIDLDQIAPRINQLLEKAS